MRRSCTNKLLLLSEQGAHWLQGKQKGERRAKLVVESSGRKARHARSCFAKTGGCVSTSPKDDRRLANRVLEGGARVVSLSLVELLKPRPSV